MDEIERIQDRIADKLHSVRMDKPGVLSLLREYEQAVHGHRSAPPCIVCGGKQTSDLEAFRGHALKLRDEGATHVNVGPMSATFAPRYTAPLTAETVASALDAQKPPEEPPTDEDYVP